MDLNQTIFKYALQNAVKYKGKANPGNVIPKVLGDDPSLKAKIKDIIPDINKIVKEVNSMSLEEQTKKLKEIAPELLEKKEPVKKELKELDNVPKDGVIMRFAPSPSGSMHIGHAATGCLSALYVQKYGGKYILRIEDTNASNIYPPAYEMIPEEGRWLFGKDIEVIIQSDRIKVYYDYAEKLFDLAKIYVCTCSQEDFKVYSTEKKDCPCRNLSIDENKERWKKMLSHFKQGDAVVRFKTSMQDKNPAMRDFPLFRINEDEHPKQGKKYRVWPLMNMSVAVDDIEFGMTHIIRGKDHADNAKKQKFIFDALEKPFPETYFMGRIKFEGLEISCSKTKVRIENGEFSGWDDIRLPFLEALRRRGYQPEAFLRFAKEIGYSAVDKVMSGKEYFKTLSAFNKEAIEAKSKRFFMIKDPVKIDVVGFESKNVELDLHPDEKKGGRKIKVSSKFLIEMSDFDRIKPDEICRLMDCLNFKSSDNGFEFVSEEYEDFKEKGKIIIHWLPDDDKQLVDIGVLMPDNTTIQAKAEKGIEKIKQGDIIQFERFGFCRLDSIEKGVYQFWFGHK